MVAVILRPPWQYSTRPARVRLFATHSCNPLVVYKAFQFALSLLLFLPRPLGYDCNDFGLLYLYSSHIVHEHACAPTGSHLCTRLHCCSHGPVHHRNGIMWHTINLSGNDGTHTHKHCDMHMHSIPFTKLLLCMFVQATDLMYRLSVYCCTYPLYKYSF